MKGVFPSSFIVNPFGYPLFKWQNSEAMIECMLDSDLEILEEMMTNTGESLHELTFRKPVMLIFLRHFGCVFCKEAMTDIAARRKRFEKQGFHIVFVHMSDTETATKYFDNFNLEGITFINDPQKRYYNAFGLFRGSLTQLFGLQTWIRGYKLKKKYNYELEQAKKLGDSFQMPGVFVIYEGEIKDKFVHNHAAQRPDYDRLLDCCSR